MGYYKQVEFLINPRYACAGVLRYLSWMCVCLSVTTLAATSVVCTLLTCGFSIKPSVLKLWGEKANMQISIYSLQRVLGHFEYRACISRYLK